MTRKIVAAALGDCVHVAGIHRFLRLAEASGWQVVFLGPAQPVDTVIRVAEEEKADMVAVSYRLTPDNGERLLGDFAEAADGLINRGVRFVFGGTPPVVQRARKFNIFEKYYEGGEPAEDVLAYLRGQTGQQNTIVAEPDETLRQRLERKNPYPLIRHHFGLPTLQSSIEGIQQIADAGVLDVVSLGVDQDAQENFFHPERQNPASRGAGGVPVRTESDLEALYQASRTGNYPLMRSYSGTDDFIQMAGMLTRTIHNAWCAIPLFWFNRMDGRGPWDLAGSISQHQQVMRWYGERGIPVEMNEPHHWGMRDAPDVIYVVSAYLAAYNARAFGVRDYIAQYMFNSPFGISDAMDLAKMLAIRQLTAPLEGMGFRIITQTRTGLLSYPLEPYAAMGHLAASVYVQMMLKPQIVHVVSFSEADHAATAADVIGSCRIARRVIENTMEGAPDGLKDEQISLRVDHLVREAQVTLQAIRDLADGGVADPLTDADVLEMAVTKGILDAPQLQSNPYGLGRIKTGIVSGCCEALDEKMKPISERERIGYLQDQEV
jgi:methylmalonyl-CoA mutase cobalamin-binding subunit